MNKIIKLYIILFILLAVVSGCANQQFQQVGTSILTSTGMVSHSQATSFFQASDKLSKAASSLSEEEEYYLGRGVSAVILSKYRPLRNRPLQEYVGKVGTTVAAFSSRPETFIGYRFMVLDTDEVNAVSAPGGFIFVTKGFLKIMPDEEALAAVLAHEVAHVALGHGVQAISESNLTQALTIIGKEAALSSIDGMGGELVNLFGDSIKDVADTLLTKGYSRSQEYRADTYALEVLNRSGYNSAGLVTMLNALANHGSKHSDSEGWFSTHPNPMTRADKVKSSPTKSDASSDGEKVRTSRFKAVTRSLS